jgi:hypothetical protein
MTPWRIVLAPSAAATIRTLPPDVKRSVREALRALPRILSWASRFYGSSTASGAAAHGAIASSTSLPRRGRQILVVAIGHRTSIYEELARERVSRERR